MEEVKTCLIIGAAPLRDPRSLLSFYHPDDFVICADGGLRAAQECGIHPDLAVGDFDSFEGVVPEELPVIPLNPRKDDTDMLAAVNVGLERGFRRFVLAGSLGGRLDHSYGNLCVLHHLHELGCDAVLMGEEEEAYLVGTGEVRSLNCAIGTTVSVFTYACNRCNVSYTGMRYPLDHQDLVSDLHQLPMGVSNVVEESSCSIAVHSGLALVLVVKEP